uniref:Uncharacterized protein n=1 Tax=Micrurus corallinus TaxID=54390 RepID=A0A2D4GQM0_MICCO
MDLAHHFQGVEVSLAKGLPPWELHFHCSWCFFFLFVRLFVFYPLLLGPGYTTHRSSLADKSPLGVGLSHGHLAKDTEVRLTVDAALEFWPSVNIDVKPLWITTAANEGLWEYSITSSLLLVFLLQFSHLLWPENRNPKCQGLPNVY